MTYDLLSPSSATLIETAGSIEISTRLYGVTSQKPVVFMCSPVRTLYLLEMNTVCHYSNQHVSVFVLLFLVAGTVTSVDEETAFSWPVCGICENELLVELGPNEYLCQNCDSSAQTYTKMSLEVFVSCPQVPESCRVRVKVRPFQQFLLCHVGTYT